MAQQDDDSMSARSGDADASTDQDADVALAALAALPDGTPSRKPASRASSYDEGVLDDTADEQGGRAV